MYAWFLVLVTIPATLVLVRAALERRTRLLIASASAFVALVLVQSVPFRSRTTHQSSLPRSR
jgi:O-antigen ligase